MSWQPTMQMAGQLVFETDAKAKLVNRYFDR